MAVNNKISFNKNEQAALKRIDKKVASGLPLEDIFEFIYEELGKTIPLDRLDLAFTEDDNQRIILYFVKADYDPPVLVKDYVIDVHGSLFQRSIDSGVTYIIDSLEEATGEKNLEPADLLINEGIKSYLVSPIIIDNNKIGVIALGSKKDASYTDHGKDFVQSILDRIQLIVEKSYRLIQLEKTTKTYMDMLSVVSHEMKSPLSSIITLGKTLSDGYFGKIDEKHRDVIERMIKQAEYLHALSNEYLSLSRFESGEFQINPKLIDFLDEVIDPALEIIKPQIDERKMKLIQNYGDNIYPHNCDPDLLRIVLVNLLSNAVKYGNPGGEIRLTMEHSFKKLRISVWNQGPGFAKTEKKRLFRKFSRLQSKELVERKGTGVGLYVTWRIIQLHGGIIKAESEKGKWAEFFFELPQYMDMCIIE